MRDVGDEVGFEARELVGAAHLADGEAEADADADVEQDQEPDVERAVAEGEGGGGIVARQLGGERESVERGAEGEAGDCGRAAGLGDDALERGEPAFARRHESEVRVFTGEFLAGQRRDHSRQRDQIELDRQRSVGSADQRPGLPVALRFGAGEDMPAGRDGGGAAGGILQRGRRPVEGRDGRDQRIALAARGRIDRVIEARHQLALQRLQPALVLLGEPALDRGALVGHRDHAEGHQRHAGQQHSAQQPDEGAAEFDQLGRLRHLLSF